MKFSKKLLQVGAAAIVFSAMVVGCSKKEDNTSTPKQEVTVTPTIEVVENVKDGLVFDHSMELSYATNFSVDYYVGGYKLVTISDGKKFFTVPEGKEAPEGVDSEAIILQMPINNILISSTPTMSLIHAIGALDAVTMTTTERETWLIDDVITKMDKGEITFVGTYKAPDYEILTSMNPPFSVFSTMLSSVPEVAEKLDELKSPYLLDQSTYEAHPLGRMEWVKLYGALFDCEDKANEVFQVQEDLVKEVTAAESTQKTAAIFYITSKGVLYVRQGGDYVAKMFELAGGEYIFSNLNPEETGTSKMEMEEFYATAKDADYIIYIWNLGGKPETLKEFTDKNELFTDFKAVKEGNVWCTTPDFFQISDTLGNMIKDMNSMLTLDDPTVDKFTYLFRLK